MEKFNASDESTNGFDVTDIDKNKRNSIVASQSSLSMINSDNKWSGVILTGENEPVLEGTIWKHEYKFDKGDYHLTISTTLEFSRGGKLIRNSITKSPSENKTSSAIDSWSRDGDNVKIIYGDGATLFEGKYHSNIKKIIGAKTFSDGRTTEETYVPFVENKISDIEKSNNSQNSSINYPSFRAQWDDEDANTNVRSNPIEPPSKGFIIATVALLIIGAWMAISSYSTNIHLTVFGFIVMGLALIPLNIYLSAQSKFHYKAVCADMARWVGRSSNDLIIQWGAPTKTYKFPGDKTMTVLEYKESIRNYAGYRSKGLYMGQSKTTKYVKSFFVKNGVIVDYKYAIS